MFRLLNASGSGCVTLNEFYRVYDVVDMKWRKRENSPDWFDSCDLSIVSSLARQTYRLVTWKFFEYFVCESRQLVIQNRKSKFYFVKAS